MNELPPIITERVDDIPLFLEQMQRMGLPSLLDDHFPTHGNWQGLSLGWVATIWLSSILSRGDHRLVHVEPWGGNRLWTRRATTGQAVERLDFPDDRLEIVLHSLHDDTRGTPFDSTLNRHTVRVYALPTARVHVESTRASGSTTASENGLLQFGHSKDYRPDLPQVKGMQAGLDPVGMPLATDVVSGERADAPLYVPCIRRVQASLGRHGLLSVGDCKMASRETRALLAAHGDVYWCPLPAVPLAEGELEKALEAVWNGEQTLRPVVRERHDGTPELLAAGDDYRVPMSLAVAGALQSWTERRLGGRSVRQAQASERALRARVAKAMAAVEALNQCGRGKKRFEDVSAFRQTVVTLVQRYGVEEFLWRRSRQHATPHVVRAYRDRPARIEEDRQATGEVRGDEVALEAAVRRLGWRVYGTKQPREPWSLAQAVLADRRAYLVERSLGRLQGRPLSLTPRSVQRDDHATGLIRLLSLALRVFTLREFVGRRRLAAEGTPLAGLYAGNAKRETARPTAERLLEALQDLTLPVIEGPHQTYRHLTALSPLQQRILEILGFSSEVYTKLLTVFSEPP